MRKSLHIISAIIFLVISTTNSFGQWLSTSGNKITKDGNPVTLRGVNFGSWLVWEGYMMNIDVNGKRSHTEIRNNVKFLLGWDEAKAVNFENNWRNNFITEADFQQAKAKGYNTIRIPFQYKEFWNGSGVKDDGFVWLDKAVKWATNQQIHVIFCLHAAPGFQNPDYHCDNSSWDDHSGPVNFWSNWDNVNIAGDIWRHIAYRYKDNTNLGNGNVAWIAGYELLNEPVLASNKSLLMESYKQMTAKIRQHDRNHIVFVEGNYWGGDYWDMLEKFDSKLVWAPHYYGGQGEANPNPNLSTIKSQADNLDIPLVFTEFGENTESWVEAATVDYETSNISWVFWSWKRHSTNRSLFSWNTTSGWDQITNYIKYGGTRPSVSQVETWLNEIYQKIKVGNSEYQSSLGNALRPGWPADSTIPQDIYNIALNKTVTTTGTIDANNTVSNMVDGNVDTRISASGYPQTISIDLGALYTISYSELVCYDDRAYQYTISCSTTENGPYTEVVNRSSNTTAGTVSAPLTDVFSATAQYIQINVTGAHAYTGAWVSISEFRVFGEEADAPHVATQSIELQSGWNLVSLYVNPSDNMIASIFPNATTVKTQDSFWSSSLAPFLNSLTNIDGGAGYLVYNTKAETINIAGLEIIPAPSSLHTGWNLVGVPSSSALPLATYSDAVIIKDFNGFYEVGNMQSSLIEMESGKAYFIKK